MTQSPKLLKQRQTRRKTKRMKRGWTGGDLGKLRRNRLLAGYLQGFYKAPRPDSTETSTHRLLKHIRERKSRTAKDVTRREHVWGADLRVHQGVVEKDEPVDGKAAGVLHRERFVAALVDESAARLPQGVLATNRAHIHPAEPPRDTKDARNQRSTVIFPGKLFQKWKVYSASFLFLFSCRVRASNLEQLSCSFW